MSAWSVPVAPNPLSPEERERLVSSLVREVARRGLVVPALWILEMHRPLAFTFGQGLMALTPLLGPLCPRDRLHNLSQLLCEPGIVDELIIRIEGEAQAQTSTFGLPEET